MPVTVSGAGLVLVRPESPALAGHPLADPIARRQDSAAQAAKNASTIVSLSAEGRQLAYGRPETSDRTTPDETPETIHRAHAQPAVFGRQMSGAYPAAAAANYQAQLDGQSDAGQEVVFKLDGRVVGSISSAGTFFSDSELGLLAASAGDNPQAVAANLRRHFGSRIEVQTFAPGRERIGTA